jgi:hypothetical protein
MKKLTILLIVMFVFSACSPATTIPVATISPTNTVTLSPAATETFTPEPTSTATFAPTSTLSPDTMIYHFDSTVNEEDRALIKEGVQTARYYLVNNFRRDINGSYLINVKNDPSKQESFDLAGVNGQVLTINVGHHLWVESYQARRLKSVIHESTHFWQHEQGGGPGCGFLYDAVGYPASHDPMTNVLDEGQAEYVGYMAAGLEKEAFTLTAENLVEILSPANRNMESSYSVMKAGVYWLIQQKSPMAFTKYCAEVVQGKTFPVAFESGFGMTVEEFTKDFKQYLLEGLTTLCSQNSTCDKGKLATIWQAQEGCFAFTISNLYDPIDFLTIGYPRYIAAIADGKESEVDPRLALGVWQANQWDEKIWFVDNIVSPIAFKNLFDSKGVESFITYCNAIAQDNRPQDAFKSAFGLTVQEFRLQFKEEVLGVAADCTLAKCGAGVDNYSDKYKLGHLLDPSRTTPNLIVKFVDQNNEPVILSHVSMLKQNVGTTGEYAQPFIVPGTFSEAMLPGRYSFFFCEPGYPTDQNDGKCQYHETDWFDVSSDQATEVTFQLPLPIKNPNLSSPNLIVKFLDKDGSPLPNLDLQICSYESPVKICSQGFSFPDRKTDANGVFQDSLRSGKYLIRILLGGVEFNTEVRDLIVNESGVTKSVYQFPIPNLIVKFTDANGSLIPDHGFVLCKVVEGVGDCNSSAYNQGRWGSTSEKGIFEALVEPGDYYILTCKIDCSGYPFDYTIKDVIVASPTEVTTVEYQLNK